jgi:hypothetical protein
MRTSLILLFTVTLHACVSRAATQAPSAPAVPAQAPRCDCAAQADVPPSPVAEAPRPEPVAAPAPAVVVASTDGDLDGDGVSEQIRLMSDGNLRVFRGNIEVLDPHGQPAMHFEHFEPLAISEYHPGVVPLRVIDIDRRDRQHELMLVEQRSGDDDPPAEYSFWVYREGRFHPMLEGTKTISQGDPTLDGLGTVRFVSGRCVRETNAQTHAMGISERITTSYVLTDGVFAHDELMVNVRSERRPAQCQIMACPVVYTGTSERPVGEILRNLRSANLAQWQSLHLPVSSVDASGVLTVTLREEKREITQLDGVYLEVDGRRVEADECARGGAAWCAADGVHQTLTPGQSLHLRFRVGSATSLTLWATGYYQPFDERGEPR